MWLGTSFIELSNMDTIYTFETLEILFLGDMGTEAYNLKMLDCGFLPLYG